MSRLYLVSVALILTVAFVGLVGCKTTTPAPPPEAPPPGVPTANPTPTPPTPPAPPSQPAKENKPVSDAKQTVIIIKTVKGDIKVELFDKQTPITAGNFLLLAEDGFYNGLTFHRVVPGFVIQGGDPKGNGSGGPGFTITDEIGKGPGLERGILSMAKTSAPNSAGSQFFVVTGEKSAVSHLDKDFTTFGKVLEGMDVVDKIAQGDKITKMEIVSTSPDAEAARTAAKAGRTPGDK